MTTGQYIFGRGWLDSIQNITVAVTGTAATEADGGIAQVSRNWYDMGGAVITNGIIGDALFINLVIDGIFKPDYLVPVLLAKRAPTQAAMDRGCSQDNVLFVPFRAQLLVSHRPPNHPHTNTTLTLTLPKLLPRMTLTCSVHCTAARSWRCR